MSNRKFIIHDIREYLYLINVEQDQNVERLDILSEEILERLKKIEKIIEEEEK